MSPHFTAVEEPQLQVSRRTYEYGSDPVLIFASVGRPVVQLANGRRDCDRSEKDVRGVNPAHTSTRIHSTQAVAKVAKLSIMYVRVYSNTRTDHEYLSRRLVTCHLYEHSDITTDMGNGVTFHHSLKGFGGFCC
jgi:hypothetical protein